MREPLSYAFVFIATIQKILSVPTFLFVDSRFVFTTLVKNIILVWRPRALGDTFLPNLPYHSIVPFILPYAECEKFDLSWIHGWLETMRTRMMVGLRQIWPFGVYLLFLIRHILHSWVVWNNNNYWNALKQLLLHWPNTPSHKIIIQLEDSIFFAVNG